MGRARGSAAASGRSASGRPFQLIVGGVALAFLSLFLTWAEPTPYTLLTGKRVGSVTETRDETGRLVSRLDTTRIRPDARTEFTAGQDGFDYAGPVVLCLLALCGVLGGVALWRGSAVRWQAGAGLALLAVLAWNVLVTLGDAGLGFGTFLYLLGVALALAGAVMGWLPALRGRSGSGE